MSGYSTPKRPLDPEEVTSQGDDEDFWKRVRLEDFSAPSSGFTSRSRSPYEEHSVQQDTAWTAGALLSGDAGDHSQPNQLPALPEIWLETPSQGSFKLPLLPHGPNEPQLLEDYLAEEVEEDICFGMLKNIPIRVDPVQTSEPISIDEIPGLNNEIFAYLSLHIDQDRCEILAGDKPIATMNTRTHNALKALSGAGSLTWKALIPKVELQRRLAKAGDTLSISILILGPASVGEQLARDLGRYQLFLQQPHAKPVGILYENPQCFRFAEGILTTGAVLPPLLLEKSNRRNANSSPDFVLGDIENDEAAPEDQLGPIYFDETDFKGSIKTELQRHQREGVEFVLRKESVRPVSSKDLWRLESEVTRKPIYKHIITGATSTNPTDILGGLLADDMGLGKTLTMIASIVASRFRSQWPSAEALKDRKINPSLVPVNSTLVIVPSALLLDGWLEEIKRHVNPDVLNCYKYHGSARSISINSDLPYDIVLSTYATVESDSRQGGGVLICFHWHRLILDEAHVVRNASTKQFQAIANLSASIRWCITGTPIQNSLIDIASLVRLLRIPQLENAATFRKHIEGRSHSVGRPTKKLDFAKLKLLLESIYLRRNMEHIFPALGGIAKEYCLTLSKAETIAYRALKAQRISYQRAISMEPARKSRKELTGMLRERMFCNTGLMYMEGLTEDEIVSLLEQDGKAVCSVCNHATIVLTPVEAGTVREHELPLTCSLKCEGCAQTHSGNEKIDHRDHEEPQSDVDGDVLMQDVQSEWNRGFQEATSGLNYRPYPTKLVALLADIKEHYKQEKSIVFSFWRRSLDLVGKMLEENGVRFSRVDGIMKPSQRKNALIEFQNIPSLRVLLMTIGTGAVGLNNLSVASRVHILEPQWNPSVEDQAIGRVWRLGQVKKVCVIRYVMKETVEEEVKARKMRKTEYAVESGLRLPDQDCSVDGESDPI